MICSTESLAKIGEKDSERIQFQMPNQLFSTRLFRDPNILTKELVRLGMKYYFTKGRIFDREDHRNATGIKMVFRCKNSQCKSKLIYFKKANEQFFEPVVFDNFHCHKRSKDSQKARRQDINLFIMQLRGEEYEKYRKISRWEERFNVSKIEGLYIVENVYWCNNTEDETLIHLAHENTTIRRVHQNGSTLLIFMVTEGMKKNFQNYGESITIETHHDTGKKRTVLQDHAVGYFFGQNQNLGLVLLGIFMISEESKTIYKKLFQFFFETAGVPISIFSDQKQAINLALEELKLQKQFQYAHFHPWYHMTRRLMEKLRRVKDKERIMDVMCQAMRESNPRHYYLLMCELKTRLKGEQKIFDYFAKNEMKYCLCRMPVTFSGYAISTAFGKKVIAQVTSSAVYRAHSGRFFTRLIKIDEQLKRSSRKIKKISMDVIKHCPQEITELWQKIEANVMEILVTNYQNSRHCQKQEQNAISVQIKDHNSKQFQCKFLIGFDHWECECHQLQRTGIPCCHLLKIILDPKYRASFSYYINSRWLRDKEDKNSPMIGAFITNKLRRH